MRMTRPSRIRPLRLLSAAFLVTALLASGGTAAAARKKAKAPAADQAETPPAPAATAPAQEAPAQETPAPAEAAAPAAAAPAPAPEPEAPTPPPPTPAVVPAAPGVSPAPAAPPEAGAASPQRKRSGKVTELGLSPQTTSYAADNAGPPAAAEAPAEDWGFRFHGFFRGPMRLSMGTEPGRGLQVHAPPVTPDLNYTTWSYTNNNPGPWGEMMFQYGNNRAIMTMAIASYNITSGGWRELQDQLGIDRAFLTLNFPDALGDPGKTTWNVGVFSDRYGAMGKYDGGAYDTYMIGRTRVAGATETTELDIADDFKLVCEEGIGAKMDVPQWKKSPYASWEPYPGYAQMGTSLLAHAHVGGVYANILTLTGHVMYTWTMDAMRTDMNNPTAPADRAFPGNYITPALTKAAKDGKMLIVGADLRLDGGWMGIGYLGYSHVKTSNVGVLQDTIETMHSQGGWQYAANYTGKIAGNGTLDSIGLQYTFSLAAFMLRPQAWWGQGADLTVQVFGLFNHISGIDFSDKTTMAEMGTTKFKAGTQVLYTPIPVMSVGARFDEVQPNMNDSTHSFWVVSPKLIFRTEFVTHEQVTVQYQYYGYGSWYNKNTDSTLGPWPGMPYPYGQLGALWNPIQPDKHTFTIAASMWW